MSFKTQFSDATGWNTVDTNRKLTKRGGDEFIAFLKENNVHTVIRYYASSERSKTFDAHEAKLLASEGFAILPVYQDRNRLEDDFSEAEGRTSARNALRFADRLRQPDGSTILFAVDADLSQTVIENNVSAYFRGVKEEMASQGRSFRIGVYGSGLTCRTLMKKGLVQVPWLSMSRLFKGTKDFFESDDWMLRQIPLDKSHPSGFSFDRNLMRVDPSQIGAFTYDEDGEGVIVGRATVVRGPTAPLLEPIPGPAARPKFPGDTVWERSGHGPAIVKLIQQRLNEVGYGPITVDGDFGSTTTNVVRDFQSQNDDRNGEALDVDGKVGELTWGALFFEEVEKPVPDVSHLANLNEAFVAVCRSQIGVMEDKPFKNRGPRVDGFIRSTGIEPFAGNFPWCVAFLYWCGLKLCEQRGIDHPMPQTAGVHRMWQLGKKDDSQW